MMRVGVDFTALAALHDQAVGLMMRDIDEEFGFAGAAAIGLVAVAFFDRASGGVLDHVMPLDGGFRDDLHIKLRHVMTFLQKQISRQFPCVAFEVNGSAASPVDAAI